MFESIRPADLLIDEQNPRIAQPNAGQHKALQSLAALLQGHLQKLAAHIVKHGINPSDLPIVMPFKDDLKRYIVLEGNRRLAALRALENPEALGDSVGQGVLTAIRKLSRDYQNDPIENIQCYIVKDREEARPWIELRHTGFNEGAGTIPWGHEEKGRYKARTGSLPIQSQALNLLEENGNLTPESRKAIPVTSFKRLLDTPEVRVKLGVEAAGGVLSLLGSEKQVSKALMYVINRLKSGTTKVTDIYTKPQRIAFANHIPADIVVTPTHASGHGVPASKASGNTTTRTKGTAKSLGKPRDKLIPRDCILNITDPRLRKIEDELRHLSLGSYQNAVSVLLRVFIELGVDSYIDRLGLTGIAPKDLLYKKLEAVTSDLLTRRKLSAQQAKPVRRALAKDSYLAASIDMMHAYIHNQYMFPAPSDLRANWDSLQPFVVAMWAP